MNARTGQLVTVAAVAAVAVALGLYAHFGVKKPHDAELARQGAAETLLPQGPGAHDSDGGTPQAPVFTWVSVRTSMSTTVMELKNGTWRLTSPVSALADKSQVDELLREVSAAKYKASLEENPTDADLERYGLQQPQISVTARTSGPDAPGAQEPGRSVTFHLGRNNPFDDSVYLRREGDPRVHVASGALRFAVMKPSDTWRDRHLFPVSEPALLRIEVKARVNALTLERATTDKPWRLVKPETMIADPQRVARMVTGFTLHSALLFPDARREALVRQALEKPQVEATFVRKVGGPVHVRLVGLEVEGFKRVYALSEWDQESVLAQVDNSALDELDVTAREFADKKVLAFDARGVQQVLVRPVENGEIIKLIKAPDSGRWEVLAPLPGLAREFKVASLLGSLEKLKAEALGEPAPKNWSRYGIGEGSRGVTLMDGTGEVLARLWLGSEVKGHPERLWARGVTGDVLELSKATLAALPLELADLLENTPDAKGTR